MSQLRPCSACRRHVRAEDRNCPFCGAASSTLTKLTTSTSARGLGRAALLALGAATAAAGSVGACTSGSPSPGDASTEAGSPSEAGGPIDAPLVDSNVPDTGNIAKPYGAPPADGLFERV